MSGSTPLRPLIQLGAVAPACEGDACLVPGTAGEQGVGSSPTLPTHR